MASRAPVTQSARENAVRGAGADLVASREAAESRQQPDPRPEAKAREPHRLASGAAQPDRGMEVSGQGRRVVPGVGRVVDESDPADGALRHRLEAPLRGQRSPPKVVVPDDQGHRQPLVTLAPGRDGIERGRRSRRAVVQEVAEEDDSVGAGGLDEDVQPREVRARRAPRHRNARRAKRSILPEVRVGDDEQIPIRPGESALAPEPESRSPERSLDEGG